MLNGPAAVTARRLAKVYDADPARPWRAAIPGLQPRPRNPTAALAEIDLVVPTGQALGIIGPNGAGKSTLLRLVAGVTRPTSGSVDAIGDVRAIIELGVGFHPELTGWENLRCSGVMLGRAEAQLESDSQAIAAFAGIEDAMDRPLKHYSTGMQARLAVALATHGSPDVLAVDEVLAVGDRDFQMACIRRISDMIDTGTTLLFVSHEMALVAQLCTRAIHIREGRIVDDGPATEVVERYLSRSGVGLERASHRPVTLGRCQVPAELPFGAPLQIEAELEVHEPVRAPAVALDLRLPMFDPDRALVSSIDDLAPLVPGRYRLRGTGLPISYEIRNLRFELSVLDRSLHRMLDITSVDLAELGGGEPGSVGAKGFKVVLPLTWDVASSPTSSARPSAPTPAPGPLGDAPRGAVRLRGASKTYRPGAFGARRSAGGAAPQARVALDDVSLDIAPGEAVGIVGPNAAGKSTLLRAIAGITELDAGTIDVHGRVAPVLQLGAGFHPDLSGRENLWTLLRLLGMASAEVGSIADTVIDFAGLGAVIDAPVKHYSTGMIARLGLAIALHVPAEILAIDETLAVGDEGFRQQVLQAIEARHREGQTILLVSHELQLIELVCGRVIRLDHGRCVDDGPTEAVLAGYSGRSWAGGTHDATGGIRLPAMKVGRTTVPTGGLIEVEGQVIVDTPSPSARLEVALRAAPPDRSAVLSVADRDRMSIVVETLVPAGGLLAHPGTSTYRCTLRADQIEGHFDLVLAVIDEREDIVMAETWRNVTVGSPGPDGVPTMMFDVVWELEALP